MYPIIDCEKTGKQIKKLMQKNNVSVKQLQQYLGLGSVQTIYHWFENISIPSIDNIYAMSQLFQVDIDDIIVGTKIRITDAELNRKKRLNAYNYLAHQILIEKEFY